MKQRIIIGCSLAILVVTIILLLTGIFSPTRLISSEKENRIVATEESGLQNPGKRFEWMMKRMVDPETGKLPPNIFREELAYAATLPSDDPGGAGRVFDWYPRGPHNVGGRTRALAIDVTNENILIAGGVSGGLWRSSNGGNSWSKVLKLSLNPGISCLAQDKRTGKTNIWYAGTGEVWGNSASAGYTADYYGNGIYKSVDGGLSWDTISSTYSTTPQTADPFDQIWRIATDPARSDSDIVYAATLSKIYRSNNGGKTWTKMLGPNIGFSAYFTEVIVTPAGIVYSAISSFTTTGANTGVNKGIWRSTDGLVWTQIKPAALPSSGQFWRIVMDYNSMNENELYFLANTPGSGQMSTTFTDDTEWNSLWKYTYISGDGSGTGGSWEDLSINIPVNGTPMDQFYTQGSYDMCIAIKPDEPNVVFLGGTNLYRSTDGFTTSLNITHIGGYGPGSTIPYYTLFPGHHPDQHLMLFRPSNPGVMISTNDGGIYQTSNCLASPVVWDSLMNGYVTSQFYTIAIDHGSESKIITGGLQDNGSRWTNSESFTATWTFPSDGDGSFCAIENGGNTYYYSRQEGKVLKMTLDATGNRIAYSRIDPIGGRNYTFISPFILDPTDNKIMYLCAGFDLWRNSDLSVLPLDNQWDSISTNWQKIFSLPDTLYHEITAIACSNDSSHTIYVGTSKKKVYRIDTANTGIPSFTDISNFPYSGIFITCVAVDPRDAGKVAVVFSNYNSYSIYYSVNGGTSWQKTAGNLEEPQAAGPPVGMGKGAGPSIRWISIIPVKNNRTIYLAGTSVGLFGTDTLIDELTSTDSTLWVKQGNGTIGNSVVEMIDYRLSDGYVAVATHGSGIYSTYITNADDLTRIRWTLQEKKNNVLNIFPNPVKENCTISFSLSGSAKIRVIVSDNLGKAVLVTEDEEFPAGYHSIPLRTTSLLPGIYYVTLQCGKSRESRKFIKIGER